jgi:cytochrome c
MSGFELNKIAAAVFLAGIIAMITGYATGALYHVEETPETRGYTIAGVDLSGGPVAAAPKEEKPVDILAFMAEADIAKGEALKKKCAACHGFDKGGANKVGPNLWGVMGRDIASKAGYAYSSALQELPGNWDFQAMSEFLKKPKNYAPGTKMAFIGLKKPEDRADIIAYMRSLSDSPLPIPAYVPPAPEVEPLEEALEEAEEAINEAEATVEAVAEPAAN